jgi:hypothetical protein
MKKNILSAILGLLSLSLFAQTTVKDSVSLGAPITTQVPANFINDSVSLGAPAGGFSYPNDVYYNLRNGNKTTVIGYNWHLAFATRKVASQSDVLSSVTVLANEGRGVSVYESSQTTATWNTFDTTGYTTWVNPHNSDSTWNIGAFNANSIASNPFDFGWGAYNLANHNVEGNKVFLIRIAVGSTISFKKVTITSLSLDSAWTFTYANLDNSDSTTRTIVKSAYPNKLFAYHNLLNDTTYNREPNNKWDVLFTRYGAYSTQFGQTIFSANSGVLTHPNVLSSKVINIPTNLSIPGLYANNLTGIGADWKENPGPGQPLFLIKDSTTYFTKDLANEESKLVFTAFRGSSTGVITFKRANALPQTIVLETYPNDVFYNMATGKVSTVKGSNWHLAFAIRNATPPFNVMKSTTILANEGRGVTVYESTQPISNFAAFDTAGYSNWTIPHNSDSTWDIGALNANKTSSATDFGWGEYDMTSHDLVGTKIFLIKIAQGTGANTKYTFKKIMISKLAFDTTWEYTYANLDNSNTRNMVLNKSNFAGKLFAYQNLLLDSIYDREPSAKWDLLFTRYGANATQFNQTIFSTNTGALSYPTFLTSKVSGVPTDSAAPGVFSNRITGIGTDWKLNPGPGQPTFAIIDSLTYFTKNENNLSFKLVFKGFAGSSTGTILFTKTAISLSAGITSIAEIGLVNMYPNPAKNTLNIELNNLDECTLSIIDIAGRTQLQTDLSSLQNSIDISSLQSGMYFVKIHNQQTQKVVRLLVQ